MKLFFSFKPFGPGSGAGNAGYSNSGTTRSGMDNKIYRRIKGHASHESPILDDEYTKIEKMGQAILQNKQYGSVTIYTERITDGITHQNHISQK